MSSAKDSHDPSVSVHVWYAYSVCRTTPAAPLPPQMHGVARVQGPALGERLLGFKAPPWMTQVSHGTAVHYDDTTDRHDVLARLLRSFFFCTRRVPVKIYFCFSRDQAPSAAMCASCIAASRGMKTTSSCSTEPAALLTTSSCPCPCCPSPPSSPCRAPRTSVTSS